MGAAVLSSRERDVAGNASPVIIRSMGSGGMSSRPCRRRGKLVRSTYGKASSEHSRRSPSLYGRSASCVGGAKKVKDSKTVKTCQNDRNDISVGIPNNYSALTYGESVALVQAQIFNVFIYVIAIYVILLSVSSRFCAGAVDPEAAGEVSKSFF